VGSQVTVLYSLKLEECERNGKLRRVWAVKLQFCTTLNCRNVRGMERYGGCGQSSYSFVQR
jgi:hypothetical protein